MKKFNQWLNQRNLSEVTSPVGIGTIGYFAKEILNDIKNPATSINRIQSWLYGLLTRTPEVHDDALPPGYAEKYMEQLPKIPMPNYITVKESGGFVHFTTNTNRPNRITVGQQNEAKVTLKHYFSLNTPVDKIKDTLNHLWQTLPKMAYEFYKIALNNKDQINFKVPDQLFMLLEHPDTIVVHYYNPASGPEIQRIADSLFTTQMDRGLRVKSGFDISHPNTEMSGSTSNSHSELIAWAVAGTIMRERERVISKYDPTTFGEKLLDVIKNYGQMDQHTLYQQYLNARKYGKIQS